MRGASYLCPLLASDEVEQSQPATTAPTTSGVHPIPVVVPVQTVAAIDPMRIGELLRNVQSELMYVVPYHHHVAGCRRHDDCAMPDRNPQQLMTMPYGRCHHGRRASCAQVALVRV